jgi:threonyl-tRNA synthetase
VLRIYFGFYGVDFRPLWLSPRQAIVVPVSNKYDHYAQQVTMKTDIVYDFHHPKLTIITNLNIPSPPTQTYHHNQHHLKYHHHQPKLTTITLTIITTTGINHPVFFKVQKKLHDAGYRVDTDLDHGSTLNKKVRNAQLSQYNFILGEFLALTITWR